MPPVSMVIVIASARMANSGNWNAIEVTFCTERKRARARAATAAREDRDRDHREACASGAARSGIMSRHLVGMQTSPHAALAAARFACQAGRPVPIRIRMPIATDCQVEGMPSTISELRTSTISATPSSVPVSVP